MKSVIQKRILPMFLVVALITSFMVFPVSASAEDPSGWYNVLDYTYVNGDTNRFHFTGSKKVSLDLPERGKLVYVDFLITCTDDLDATVIYSASGSKFKLNRDYVGTGIYRYWGYINSPWYDKLDILFEGTAGKEYTCEFYTCNVSTVLQESFADVGSMLLYTTGGETVQSSMSSVSKKANVYISKPLGTFYQLAIQCSNWVKYDFIDFYLQVRAKTITSITASQGNIALPVEYSLIDNGLDMTTDTQLYTVHLRLDLSGAVRSSVSVPYIEINGTSGFVIDCSLYAVTGHIEVDSVNPLMYWFTHLENSIESCFTAIHTKLDTIYHGLITSLTGIKDSINTRFNDLKGWLESGFKSVVDKLDELVNGSVEQQAAADQFNENVNSHSGQIDQAVNDMNVARPDPGSINTSVGAITGNLDFTPLNTCVQSLVSSNTVYQCLIMAVTLMLVSYLLFGKKV